MMHAIDTRLLSALALAAGALLSAPSHAATLTGDNFCETTDSGCRTGYLKPTTSQVLRSARLEWKISFAAQTQKEGILKPPSVNIFRTVNGFAGTVVASGSVSGSVQVLSGTYYAEVRSPIIGRLTRVDIKIVG